MTAEEQAFIPEELRDWELHRRMKGYARPERAEAVTRAEFERALKAFIFKDISIAEIFGVKGKK